MPPGRGFREPAPVPISETEAYYSLLKEARRLRLRTVFAALGLSIVPGMLGAVAHATGYWSVLPAAADGSYLVASWTLVIAFLIGAIPCALAGFLAHAALRPRLLRDWQTRARVEGHLPPEAIEEIVRRVRRIT